MSNDQQEKMCGEMILQCTINQVYPVEFTRVNWSKRQSEMFDRNAFFLSVTQTNRSFLRFTNGQSNRPGLQFLSCLCILKKNARYYTRTAVS